MNNRFKHRSPEPWVAYDRGIGWEIHDASGEPINSGFRDTFSRADAELCAAAPKLLVENAFFAAENRRLKASNAALELHMIDARGEIDRVWLAANKCDAENERLRNRVAELEQLATDAYLSHERGNQNA